MRPAKPKSTPLKRLRDALKEAQTINHKLTRDLAALAIEGRVQRREIRQLKLHWNICLGSWENERVFMQRELKKALDESERLRQAAMPFAPGQIVRAEEPDVLVDPAGHRLPLEAHEGEHPVNAGCQFDGGGE